MKPEPKLVEPVKMPKKEMTREDQLFLLKMLRERLETGKKEELLAYFKTNEALSLCEFKDEQGETLLHWLVRRGDIELFKPVSFMRVNCSMDELVKIVIETGNVPFLAYMLDDKI